MVAGAVVALGVPWEAELLEVEELLQNKVALQRDHIHRLPMQMPMPMPNSSSNTWTWTTTQDATLGTRYFG